MSSNKDNLESYLFLDFGFVFILLFCFTLFVLALALFPVFITFLLFQRTAIKLEEFLGIEFSKFGYKVPKVAISKVKRLVSNSARSTDVEI